MIKHFVSKQFLKYIIIGFFGTGLDFLLLYYLVEYLHLYYILAAFISVAIVIWISFSLNKYWTFQNQEKKYLSQFSKYILAHAFVYGLNLIILIILVEIFGLWYILAKAFATIISAICNFLLTKKWVFRSENEKVSLLENQKWPKF